MAFFLGAEEDLEHTHSGGSSKDVEALVDYKQFYAKSPADSDDIESHRTGDKTILIGINVPKHRSRRRRSRHHPDGLDLSDDALDKSFDGQSRPQDSNQPIASDRLRELLQFEESRMLFCELEVLQDGEWHEKARWVRFEEDVEEGGGRWSKPFVATLSLHALFELRQCLSVGVVLLDLEPRSYQELIGLIVDSLIGGNQLEASLREEVIQTLLSKHIHQHEHGQGPIKRGLSEIGKKFSSRKMDEVTLQHAQSGLNFHPLHGASQPNFISYASSQGAAPVPRFQRGMSLPRGHLFPRPSDEDDMFFKPGALPRRAREAEDTPGLVATQLASGLGASAALVGGIAGLAGLTAPSAPSLVQLPQREESFQVIHKPNEHFAKKLAPGTEASSTMVGAVDYLNHAVSAFVRLSNGIVLDDLTEVSVPTRFAFVMLGPSVRSKDFHEIGRAMSTIMSDDIFRDVAYHARDRSDILAGLDEFLDEVTILPPGEWDPTIRIQPPKSVPTQEERKINALNQIAEEQGEQPTLEPTASTGKLGGLVMTVGSSGGGGGSLSGEQVEGGLHSSPGASNTALTDLIMKKQAENDDEEGGEHALDPTLQRTGHIFGGLVADTKRKVPWYWSDIKDAMHIQCVASIFFLFFACLSPIVTFGGLLGMATENHMAAFESILTGAFCGTTYHLFAGQPLTIIGSTGPVLVFEKILFSFSKDNDLNYLTLRFWIGIWTAGIMTILVAFDLSALVQVITRFTEESFAALISTIFIFEAFLALYGIYQDHPLSTSWNKNANMSCWCDFNPKYATNFTPFSTTVLPAYTVAPATAEEQQATQRSILLAPTGDCLASNLTTCASFSNCVKIGPGCGIKDPVPDVFFFSCIVFLGTFGLSMFLKAFRTTPFFPNRVREIVSDFAVSIAIFLMVGLDFVVGLDTPKLRVPKDFSPTRPGRPWVVQPFENPVWTIFAAFLPATLLSILLFMDQQITAVIVNRREHKLVKGNGYHLDFFILTLQIVFCATLGLPYFVAATVLAINHVNSLRKQSDTSAPGEQPKFLGIREQRVTGFLIFALIGCSVPLKGILEFIPMPVLYGVFLFMGVSALRCSQFFDRIMLVFMPVKYQPDSPYLRHMRTWRVHLFTGIQLASFAFLWIIKQIKEISIAFPLMLVIMVIIRKLLDFVFAQDELRWVDDILPKNPMAVQGSEPPPKPSPSVTRASMGHFPSRSASAAGFNRQISRPSPGNAPLQEKVNITDEMRRTTIWQRLTASKRQSPEKDAANRTEMEPLNRKRGKASSLGDTNGKNSTLEAAPAIVVVSPSRDPSTNDFKAPAPAPVIYQQQAPMYNPGYPPPGQPYYPAQVPGYPAGPPPGVPPGGPFYPPAAYPPPPQASSYPMSTGAYPPPPQPQYPQPNSGYPSGSYQSQPSQPPPIGFVQPPPLPQGYNSQAPYPQPNSSSLPYPGGPPPYGAPPSYPSQQPSYNPNMPYGKKQTPPARAAPNLYPNLPAMASQQPEDIDVFAPTVKPIANFNAQQDCEALRRAMKGLGTDEYVLINVLCHRSWQQRVEIARVFKQMFGKDLEEEIVRETSGYFRKVLKRLVKSPVELAAFELHRAIEGAGTDEEMLIEIICTKSNVELAAIKQKYQEIYKRSLEKDVVGDTSGDFKRLLVALLTANRSETQRVDLPSATADAKALYEAGEKRLGTDESRFNAILCSRSYPQLLAIFDAYKRDYKNEISAVIRSEFSGDIAHGLNAIVASVRNKRVYFAERLRYALSGAGTCDNILVHVIVSRCDFDLAAIKADYQRFYARSLAKDISDHLSGDYKKVLLALLGD